MLIKQEKLRPTQKKAQGISSPANCKQHSFSDAEGDASEQVSIQMAEINSIAALQRDNTCWKQEPQKYKVSTLSNNTFFTPAIPSRDRPQKVLYHTVVFWNA